jgi:hypothetical protein
MDGGVYLSGGSLVGPTTVPESGSDLIPMLYQSLSNAEKRYRGAVLAKPFPCLVSQWDIRAFNNNYSQL